MVFGRGVELLVLLFAVVFCSFLITFCLCVVFAVLGLASGGVLFVSSAFLFVFF